MNCRLQSARTSGKSPATNLNRCRFLLAGSLGLATLLRTTADTTAAAPGLKLLALSSVGAAPQLELTGSAGGTYRVEHADTADGSWRPLSTVLLAQPSTTVPDATAGDAPKRFYRAVIPEATAAEITAQAVAAATAFLATLSDSQRAAGVFAFNNSAQRKKWSNLPTPLYTRAGLRLGNLTAPQRAAALASLAAVLSQPGYEKALAIVEGDEVLKSQGSVGNLVFGRDEFFISYVGTPSLTDPWMLQFGGHHLAINATIRGTNGVLTPTLIAAQPATYTLNGRTVRPLGKESDLSFSLINALDATQRSQAIIGASFRDLVLGPGKDGVTLVPEGVKVSTFNASQQALLLDLIRQWACIIHDRAAEARMAEIKANLAETWFAWSGPTAAGGAAYFRIQGPTVVIEYAPQSMGGSAVNHIHTIYRDPTDDYGVKLTAL